MLTRAGKCLDLKPKKLTADAAYGSGLMLGWLMSRGVEPHIPILDGFHALPASVSKTCLVRFDTDKYSVNAKAVGRPVEIHAYADRVVIRQDGIVVGEHARAFGRD